MGRMGGAETERVASYMEAWLKRDAAHETGKFPNKHSDNWHQ